MKQPTSPEKISSLLQQMEGVIVALSTPLDAEGELDVAGLERLVYRVIAGGTSCLFILGWAGEGPLLRDRTRRALVVETMRLTRSKVPVMVGVSEQSLPRTLDLAAMAREAGADLILATPPYSYIVTQEQIYDYFKELAAASHMPLVVYQNDEVGVKVEPETLVRLSEAPGVAAVKVYMPYIALQKTFLEAHKPGRFAVMNGDEYLFAPALLLGVQHFTMGGPGNLCPGWCTSLMLSAKAGDWDSVIAKHKRLVAFCDALYAIAPTPYTIVKGALEQLGVCSARITSPHTMLTPEQMARVTKVLTDFADVVAH